MSTSCRRAGLGVAAKKPARIFVAGYLTDTAPGIALRLKSTRTKTIIYTDTWRTGWDSNPRYAFTHTRVPGVRLKPLGHLSYVGLHRQTQIVGTARYIPMNFSGST
jgi:hypothetical protein